MNWKSPLPKYRPRCEETEGGKDSLIGTSPSWRCLEKMKISAFGHDSIALFSVILCLCPSHHYTVQQSRWSRLFSRTHARDLEIHMQPLHTHTHRCGICSYNKQPLCASTRSVTPQRAEQDEGAEGVNFNLIK